MNTSPKIKSNLHISWGLSARGGKRELRGHGMQDAHAIVEHLDGNPHRAFFALYDGHSGLQAAHFAAEKLHTFLIDNLKTTNVPESLRDAFGQTDQHIPSAGTTATVAFIDGDQLYLAWVGDTRAVVVRNGEVMFATEDHKPNIPQEEQRIKAVGCLPNYDESSVARIAGLAISRTLGDRSKKLSLPNGAIIATPEIKQITLQANDSIILACDGVWDVINNNVAAFIVQQALQNKNQKKIINQLIETKQVNPSFDSAFEQAQNYGQETVSESGNYPLSTSTARMVRDSAVALKSTDNISVLVINVDQLPL